MADPVDTDVLDDVAAAALCDCEPSTMQDLARTGQLPAVKLGRSWRFPRSALLQALHDKAMANMAKLPEKPSAVLVGQARRASRRKTLPNVVPIQGAPKGPPL